MRSKCCSSCFGNRNRFWQRSWNWLYGRKQGWLLWAEENARKNPYMTQYITNNTASLLEKKP